MSTRSQYSCSFLLHSDSEQEWDRCKMRAGLIDDPGLLHDFNRDQTHVNCVSPVPDCCSFRIALWLPIYWPWKSANPWQRIMCTHQEVHRALDGRFAITLIRHRPNPSRVKNIHNRLTRSRRRRRGPTDSIMPDRDPEPFMMISKSQGIAVCSVAAGSGLN
ncbi:MAG: hypothetical protein JWM11_6162 [Planctomycetaceae bacterium]|nr:hypothetical protein [Planctomycetaceae bacterium]